MHKTLVIHIFLYCTGTCWPIKKNHKEEKHERKQRFQTLHSGGESNPVNHSDICYRWCPVGDYLWCGKCILRSSRWSDCICFHPCGSYLHGDHPYHHEEKLHSGKQYRIDNRFCR